MGAQSSCRMSARSTIETCRPDLPSEKMNVMGWEPSKKKEGKIDTHGQPKRIDEMGVQARKGDAQSSPRDNK
jgi:hypothetical protein